MKSHGSLKFIGVAAMAAMAALAPPSSAQQYTIVNLGALSGLPNTDPNSINNAGVVVGSAVSADFSQTHAFRTEPESPINPLTDDLGLLPGASSGGADAINSTGQVVGTGNISGFSHVFRIDPSAPNTLIDLGARPVTSPLTPSANANAINASGQVTGATTDNPNAGCFGIFSSRAFRTAANGGVAASDDLGTLDLVFAGSVFHNCRSSVGYSINASGQVVGWSHAGSLLTPNQHAFLATPSMAMQDLGTLGGKNSTAFGINDAGQIVGQADTSSSTHAFLVNSSSSLTMVDLGTLGGTFSFAQGINNSGQIVGSASTAGDVIDAFIYQNGTMTDLNSLIPANSGWVLQGASSINDLGQIVGGGTFNGVRAAFRLDPSGSAAASILLSELSNTTLPLTPAEVSALSAKLSAALASLNNSNTNAASGQVGAFVNQVNALVNSSRLSAADAASLISEAENVIRNLN